MQEDESEVQEAVEVVTTAKLITEVVNTASTPVSTGSIIIPTAELNVPAATPTLVPVTAAYTRRRKGVIIKDLEEESTPIKPAETKSKDRGKGIMIKEPKPMKKKDQVELDEEAITSINETLAQKATKKRKLNEEAKEVEDLKQHLEIVLNEDDDVYTEAPLLARKVPVVDYQIIQVNNKPRYKIIKADGTHQLYASFITVLKNFDREDLESLWSIVKERYLLSKFTLEQMLNVVRLQVEEQSEISLELLRSLKKNTKCVNAAGEELSAAKHKLMLLVYCC
uniref:Uncharacterized protein n=1 Tax=Tanacetum cinerariifolium TaxID=118510 RepID=A0A6L2K1P4_TANCI|nr:hypothetical protein [Tanacetum cinerariifolium]